MRRLSLLGACRVWERNFHVYSRRWMYNILPHFFEPLFYLLGMGVGLGAYVAAGGKFEGGYVAFVAPGLVAASAMNGGIFETTYNIFVKLHFSRIYDAMVTTPLSFEDVALGEILWAVTRSVLYGVAFLAITLFFGVPLTWRLLLALAAIPLIGFCFAAIGTAYTSVIDNIDLYTYFWTVFVTPSFVFSGIFFPLEEQFPPALLFIAKLTPLYHAVHLERGLVRGEWEGLGLDVLYLAVVGLTLSTFAVRRLGRRFLA